MLARVALPAFVLAICAIAVAYASAFFPGGAPAWAPWAMALGTALSMVSVMALGASRRGESLGALGWVFAATFLLVAGGFSLALGLSPSTAGEPVWLGLPRRAAILVYGIGLLPVFLLPIAYALTFDRMTLSEADLSAFRARIAALREEGTPGAGA